MLLKRRMKWKNRKKPEMSTKKELWMFEPPVRLKNIPDWRDQVAKAIEMQRKRVASWQ